MNRLMTNEGMNSTLKTVCICSVPAASMAYLQTLPRYAARNELTNSGRQAKNRRASGLGEKSGRPTCTMRRRRGTS